MANSIKILVQNMETEIKNHFDNYIKQYEEDLGDYLCMCYGSFVERYIDVYVSNYFDDGDSPIDRDTFMDKYDFNWFDAFKYIKVHQDDYVADICFDDYDDEQKSWNMFCYVCAGNVSFISSEEYEKYYEPSKEKFIEECDKIILSHTDALHKYGTSGLELFEVNTEVKFYKHLKEFDISSAEKDIQIINLIYQKYMKDSEERCCEGQYIKYCDYLKKEYIKLRKSLDKASEIKDLYDIN
jgi:hypothetical protein